MGEGDEARERSPQPSNGRIDIIFLIKRLVSFYIANLEQRQILVKIHTCNIIFK